VVFDSTLPVKHAFRALAENDIKCAPVWHSMNGDFIGFMTVTDFADILHFYAQDLLTFSRKVGELERSTVGRWCTFRKKHNQTQTNMVSRPFVFSKPNEPIFNAIYKMHQYFIHRMPVRHNQSILCILNHQTILRFAFNKSKTYHHSLNIKVGDLNIIKTKHDWPTIKHSQKVSDAVTILSTNRRISAIPICDDQGIVKDAFMRSDIRFFARNQAYENLNVSIKDFLGKYRPTQYVPKCTENGNLLDVLWEMLNKRCHVALVLDQDKKLLNIFNYYMVFEQIMDNQQMEIKDDDDNELQHDEDTENDDDIDHLNDDIIKSDLY